MTNTVEDFAVGVAGLKLAEVDCAIAFIWFGIECDGREEVSVRELADLMHHLSLRNRVNVSRLATNLSKNRVLVRGKTSGSFKLRLAEKAVLTERFAPLLAQRPVTISTHIIDPSDFVGSRRYLETLVHQVNGTYQYGFYDGCAVLCRRLVETLLIEALEQAGAHAAIRQSSGYLALPDLVGIATSGQHIKLSRGIPKEIEAIKGLGDTAAHSRTYITKRADIDDVKLSLRRAVSELAHLAKVQPKTP